MYRKQTHRHTDWLTHLYYHLKFIWLSYLATLKLGMKLYLKRLFSGKLNLWTVPWVPLITNSYVAEKEKWPKFDENTSIAKSLVSEPLAVVISGCCNEWWASHKAYFKILGGKIRKHLTMKGIKVFIWRK